MPKAQCRARTRARTLLQDSHRVLLRCNSIYQCPSLLLPRVCSPGSGPPSSLVHSEGAAVDISCTAFGHAFWFLLGRYPGVRMVSYLEWPTLFRLTFWGWFFADIWSPVSPSPLSSVVNAQGDCQLALPRDQQCLMPVCEVILHIIGEMSFQHFAHILI